MNIRMLALVLPLTAPLSGHAGSVEELLAGYQRAGAGPFRAEQGEKLLVQPGQGEANAEGNRCADCHTTDPRQPGKHLKTNKPIQPLAPVANPERLQDADKVEKWFLRNCKGTLGRPCTPQEKGDFLTFLIQLR
ncbi:MAG: DUF1924 domain-containing protein [Magnetococcales bacterium]|nr:DUF1924 domain-containing protein [Magnetococcales bacterium]